MVTRADIVAEARTWAAVKWMKQGRTRNGIDCAGMLAVVIWALQIPVDYDPGNYPDRPDGSFLYHFDNALIRKPMPEAKDGDVYVFTESNVPCHCGIATTLYNKPAVIHSHLRRGIVIEETLESAKSVI